mgnify:CR=1 FL=1
MNRAAISFPKSDQHISAKFKVFSGSLDCIAYAVNIMYVADSSRLDSRTNTMHKINDNIIIGLKLFSMPVSQLKALEVLVHV